MTSYGEVFTALDGYVERRMAASGTPGLALALTDRERTLRVATYGYADVAARTPVRLETLFEIGSIGKSFTSIALLQLAAEGRVDLHAPVTEYLPWFAVRSPYEPITPHHLMSHTAGIINGTDASPDAGYEVWSLRNTDASAPPGARFHYSNAGYKALGLALERIEGQPYRDIIHRRILRPLGMDATWPLITHQTRRLLATGHAFLYDDRPGHPSHPLVPATWLETDTGDGCLASTPADMAIYLRMLLNRGDATSGRVLSEQGFERLTGRVIEGWPSRHYGYGIVTEEIDGHTCIGHGGGMVGYFAHLLADMDAGLGVVVLVNGPGQPAGIARAALAALRAAREGRAAELPAIPDPTVIENAADYAGEYRRGERRIELIADGDRLVLHDGGDPDVPVVLERRGGDAFYVDHPAWSRFLLEFKRAGEGNDGAVVEAFHGPDWYTTERYTGPDAFDYPAEWDAYPGHYRSHNPWATNFRVVPRKGRLMLIFPAGPDGFSDVQPLVPLGDGVFRAGDDERGPERIRFDTVVEGQALRANLSGCDYYRFFTP